MPHDNAGPSLFSSELPNKKLQFVFSLANIMDYGYAGLESTIELLDQSYFNACGACKDLHDAKRFIQENGLEVGILCCCEAQFGVAGECLPGVAEIVLWIYKAIRDLSEKVDAVVVFVHAGIEDSPWPSPYIHNHYLSFIDGGADVVHGHHAHVAQEYEAYGDGVIFYGMGNFAVDPDK